MTNLSVEERNKIDAFIADMGFYHTADMISLAFSIGRLIEQCRERAVKREAELAKEWAPGGWRREGSAA